VQIHVVDNNGRELPYRIRRFTNTATGAEYTRSFQGLRGLSIPKGTYEYELIRRDIEAGRLRGRLSVEHREQWLTLIGSNLAATDATGHELAIDLPGKTSTVIEGQVVPAPDKTSLAWAKLQAVYQPYSVEARIDAGGRFHIYSDLYGDFVVMVLQGGKVMAVQLVRFGVKNGDKVIRIELPSSAPSVLPVRSS
jgi:hypothetical protein